MRIGYLIPEFPGQTHNFFWRERLALDELGIRTSLVSTRRPPKSISSPSWAQIADKETSYLFPISTPESFAIVKLLMRAGPMAWFRCAKVIGSAADLGIRGKLRLLLLLPFAAKLVLQSRRDGFQHIHVHSCADAANIALLANQLNGVSYSLTLHNPLSVYGGNQENKWKFAEFGVVITNKLYHEVITALAGHLPSVIRIAPMGVDTDKFIRNGPYKPFDGSGQLRIFSCGRLNHAKGYLHLIQAVQLLREQEIDVVLNIAGEDDVGGSGYRKVLERQIVERELEEHVNLLGAISEEHVKECLEGAHIFVLASLAEPLGVVVMEAMSMSVPVIATNAGGVPEMVGDGVDGILVPPANSQAISFAIRELINNSEMALELCKAAREKVCLSFSYKRSAEVVAEMLNSR